MGYLNYTNNSISQYSGISGGSTLKYLPQAGNWPVSDRNNVNSTATSAHDTQLTVAAINAPIRIIYGQQRVGPQIAYVLNSSGNLIILAIWCHGPIDSIQQLWLDDSTFPGTIQYQTRLGGTDNNTIPTILTQAIPGYIDTLPGIAYTVFSVPAGINSNGFPRINALIKGLKVYDSADVTQTIGQKSTYKWSSNPALCLADFIYDSYYGMSRQNIDWSSVQSVRTFNDSTSIGEVSRTLNISMENPQSCVAWLDTLRTYASCWITQDGDTIKLIPDTTASSIVTFSHDAGDIISISNINKRGISNIPNVMTINYTDTTIIPYKDNSVTIDISGFGNRKESNISLPGINRRSQATREAIERLNKLNSDLTFDIEVADIGVKYLVGDVVSVKHPIGIALLNGDPKPMRVIGVNTSSIGRYKLTLSEYDSSVYSTTIVSNPTNADTNFGDPKNPPTPTNLSVNETVYQLRDGTWSTRFDISWQQNSLYGFNYKFLVEVWNSSYTTLIYSEIVSKNQLYCSSGPLNDNTIYNIRVATVVDANLSTWATTSKIAAGKYLVPGDVPSIDCFEAGGTVYVSWSPATDKDIWKYEIRYGSMAGSWETATLVDRIDSLRVTSDQIPTGEWRIYVKAIDSVGQYSTKPTYTTVVVTSDANAFLIASKDFTLLSSTNMQSYTLAPYDTNTYYVSDDGTTVASKFTASLSTYTAPLSTYHASMTSTWLSQSRDWGTYLSGQWTGTATVSDISGSHTSYIGLASDDTWNGSTDTWTTGLSRRDNGRFARLKHECLTTATMVVSVPTQNLRVNAIPIEEVGTGTSSSTTASPIILNNSYVATKKLTIVPGGSTSVSFTYDRIVLCPYSSYAGRSCYRGDGTNGTFNVTTYSNLNVANTFTFEALVNANQVPSSTTKWVMGKHNVAETQWLFLGINTSGYAVLGGATNSTEVTVSGSVNLCDNNWHRLSGVVNGTNISLYVDSTLIGTTSIGGTITLDSTLTALGKYKTTTWSNMFNGQIADIRVWNINKSSFTDSFSSLAGSETNLVGYWKLNDKTGTTAINSVSGGTSGTVSGGLWSGMCGFDVYIFNSTTGAKIATPFTYSYQGV